MSPDSSPKLHVPPAIVGEWYLKGFADAYGAHWAVVPEGPEGEHYKKGYALGIAAVRDQFFEALDRVRRIRANVPQDAYCG